MSVSAIPDHRWRLAMLAGGAALAAAALLGTIAAGGFMQAPPAAATFAAVSIKPDQRRVPMRIQSDPAGVQATSITLRQAIVYAYNIHDYQLMGGGQAMRSQSWTQFKHFDIDATTGAPTSDADLRLMMQNVLQTRFGLRLRRDEKATPLLALVIAPSGVKFKAVAPGERGPMEITPGTMTLPFQTITDLVSRLNTMEMLGQGLTRTLVDQTGLTGTYAIRLAIPADAMTGPNGRRGFRPHWDALPAALKAEGLELKPETIPFTTYTIESAHEPAAN